MTTLWSPNLTVGDMGSQTIDVSDYDEIYVEAEGYVYVEGSE
jgi:hypothetical protein